LNYYNFIILFSIFSANDFIKKKCFFRSIDLNNEIKIYGPIIFHSMKILLQRVKIWRFLFWARRLSSRFVFYCGFETGKMRWSKYIFESVQVKWISCSVLFRNSLIPYFRWELRESFHNSNLLILWSLFTFVFLPFFNSFLNRGKLFSWQVIQSLYLISYEAGFFITVWNSAVNPGPVFYR